MEFLLNPFVIMLFSLVVLIYSAILHEIAHGFVAERLGDPTARLLGRLTLNPKPHIDPFLSILVPLLLIVSGSTIIFGGAKPVPVDPFNLKEGRKDIALVSLAGPLTNIVLAVAAAITYHIVGFLAGIGSSFWSEYVRELLFITARLNLLLAIFNLAPIPPLDGSKIFALLLPEKAAATYLSLGSMGMVILLLFLFLPTGFLQLVSILIQFGLTLLGF